MFASIFLSVAAQTLIKIGTQKVNLTSAGILSMVLAYIKSPLIIGGLSLYCVSTPLYIYSLSRFEFHYAYFLTGLTYILVLLISVFYFKETISPSRWIGCALVVLGVFLIMRG